MTLKNFLNNKFLEGKGDKKYISDPELIRKNAKELMENENFQAVMEALSDK